MVESERELGLIGTFPVSVSRAAYRGGGKGNGFFVFGRGQAVAVRAVHDCKRHAKHLFLILS